MTVKDDDAEFFASIEGRSGPWREWAKTARTAASVGISYGQAFLDRSNTSGLSHAKSEDEKQGWAYGFEWALKEAR